MYPEIQHGSDGTLCQDSLQKINQRQIQQKVTAFLSSIFGLWYCNFLQKVISWLLNFVKKMPEGA